MSFKPLSFLLLFFLFLVLGIITQVYVAGTKILLILFSALRGIEPRALCVQVVHH
jgi:hypothetical protein